MQQIWAATALLESGWADRVLITVDSRGRIEAVETDCDPAGIVTGVLLPSPTNVHSHAFQRALAGVTEFRDPSGKDSFWTWREQMYRFLERLTPEHVKAIAALVQLEMLEAGYAAKVEFHYLHHQPDGRPYDSLSRMAGAIAEAAALSGIGLTLLPVHYQYGGCDQRPLGRGQKRFGNDLDRYVRLHSETAALVCQHLPEDCQVGVAAHSLRAVAGADLTRLRQLSGSQPFHLHLAEQPAEVDEVRAAFGCRPGEWVLDHLPLNERCCLVHCTQLQPHETIGLARSGAVAGLCPITESNLGDGIFDGARWLAEAGRLAIGSDSNVRIALTEELRTLEYSQRLRDGKRAVLATAERSAGRTLYEMAALGGALAAGRDAGVIAPGHLADLVALDRDGLPLHGLHGDRLLDSHLFAGDDDSVTDVWSAGRHVVVGGVHRQRDSIVADYLNTMQDLRPTE